MAEEKPLTLKEVAERIGYNYFTVHEWITTRGMPVHRVGERGRFFAYWSEVKTWFDGLGIV